MSKVSALDGVLEAGLGEVDAVVGGSIPFGSVCCGVNAYVAQLDDSTL